MFKLTIVFDLGDNDNGLWWLDNFILLWRKSISLVKRDRRRANLLRIRVNNDNVNTVSCRLFCGFVLFKGQEKKKNEDIYRRNFAGLSRLRNKIFRSILFFIVDEYYNICLSQWITLVNFSAVLWLLRQRYFSGVTAILVREKSNWKKKKKRYLHDVYVNILLIIYQNLGGNILKVQITDF